MYFVAFLCILKTSRVNTRLSGSQSMAVKTGTPFLHVVISFSKFELWKEFCNGTLKVVRINEKFELRGVFL